MGEMGRGARVWFAAAAALLALLWGRPVWADTPGASLTLSATQGVASSAIVMTFVYPTLLFLCPSNMNVTFTWDTSGPPLAHARLAGPGCTATATVTPPSGSSAPGGHIIAAVAGSQNASAAYTILATAPTAAPTPRPTPTRTPAQARTPSPSPSPNPTPTPSAAPSPTSLTPAGSLGPTPACDTRVPQATGASGFLEVAGVRGSATEPQHAGAIVVQAMSPASMLPPAIGTQPLTEVDVTKAVDASTPALVQAVANGVRFDCVELELPPSAQYLYATYAFRDALISSYTPAAGPQQAAERLTLNYRSVDWEYQLRDGSPIHTGSGGQGDTPDPLPLQAPALPAIPVALIGVLVLGGGAGGGVLWLRRKSSQSKPNVS